MHHLIRLESAEVIKVFYPPPPTHTPIHHLIVQLKREGDGGGGVARGVCVLFVTSLHAAPWLEAAGIKGS